MVCLNLVLIQAAWAASSFSDSFDDITNISQTARVAVDTTNGQVTLQAAANTLADSNTTLFTHLGSDADITAPAIAGGDGGAPAGVTYTTGNGGHSGEAAIIAGRGSKIAFPLSGNLNPLKGTIDFWLSFSDWHLNNGRSPDYPYEEMILYAADGPRFMALWRNWNGTIQLRFTDAGGGVYGRNLYAAGFADGSWHHLTFTWNIEEDIFYINCAIDGALVDTSELADTAPNTWNVTSFASSFKPTTLYIGNRSDGQRPLNGKIDELRITSSELALTNYPGKSGVLTSKAFDTGVASPVWSKITWDETLASKTDIELQTSTSDDGVHWTNWFSTNKGMVTITFDDGYSSVFDNAYPIMSSFGFKGVPYVITDYIGSNDWLYLSLAKLQALHDAGWEIGSHGSNHTATAPSMGISRLWLMSHGFENSAFAYPGGGFTQNTVNNAADYYTTARTIRNQYQTYDTKYQLYAYPGNSGVSDVNSWLDSVVNAKAWGILTFHAIGQLGTPADASNVSVNDFASIMQYLSMTGLDVVTIAEARDRLAMYTNSSGDQIRSPSKRYIRYRAILHSYNGTNSPVLSGVTISAPTNIYKGIATTIGADGTYTYATWPQTTDEVISSLTVTPNMGSVTVTVDPSTDWDTGHRRWSVSRDNPSTTTVETVTGLRSGQPVQVWVNGSLREVLQADSSGRIVVADSGGNSNDEVELRVAASLADFDGDGDVDLGDFGHLQACLTGDGVQNTDAACADADFDGNGDVGQLDLQRFRQCLTGPNITPPTGCLDIVP